MNLEGANMGEELADVGVVTDGALVGTAPKGMVTL